MSKKDSLGDRIKRYEKVSSPHLYRKMPVICRVDGRAFHTFTRKFKKPFDTTLINSMEAAARAVADEMQGFKVGYVQSDEASFFLSDWDNIESQPWFDNDMSKIVSIAASIMSVQFNKIISNYVKDIPLVVFDARAFNLPREEVANYFLWRAKDWERNSLQMYARSVFSSKELLGKNKGDMHEMLFQRGKNWSKDISMQEKNGTFLVKDGREIKSRTDVLPNYSSVDEIVKQFI